MGAPLSYEEILAFAQMVADHCDQHDEPPTQRQLAGGHPQRWATIRLEAGERFGLLRQTPSRRYAPTDRLRRLERVLAS